ncbi:PASTA domain-containing protein [Kribbella sp. CA-247076]|uniref:PASTA domain-containing protein n=1 Tax=Kribbella sp. CA-247076 TaxID=3239941 RepID=UPI003D8E51CC
MTDTDLTTLLDRAAQRTDVHPPPIETMQARVARIRRRRTMVVSLAAAVAVLAAAGGTALALRPGPGAVDVPPPVASTSPGVAVPSDMRLVGVGRAAIAVPKTWGTNRTRCLTAQEDTVILSRDGLLCSIPRPWRVESVELGLGRPTMFEFTADETIEIDGVSAERQHTTCTDETEGKVMTCSGVVMIPSLDTWFWAESSTGAAEVDRILERIRIVSDRIGVPSLRVITGTDPGRAGQLYADKLTELGLSPKIQTRKAPQYIPGDLMGVSPAPGTMLAPGATVTLTVAAP